MKKALKISLLLIFIFFIFTISKSVEANTISKISMDIYVDSSGIAHVTEVWNCYANKGTEVYHPYYNLGSSKITNLTVTESNNTYTTLNSWNTSDSFDSKAYKCGINNLSNGIELCWGISKYGSHEYTVKYNISNFVSNLSDSQMIYWTLIPYDFSSKIGKVYIKVHSDFKYEDTLDVWGYGNYGGTCYVYDGYIEMQSNGSLDSDEYMTILVKFPQGTFDTSSNLSHDFNYYYSMSQEGSTAYQSPSNSPFSKIISMIINIIAVLSQVVPIIVIMFVAILFTNKDRLNFGSEGKSFSKDTPYFRDVPCNGDLFMAYYIAYEYGIISKKTDLLGAIILKWVKNSYIRLEQKEVGKIFKKEDTVVILNETDPSLITDTYEKKLFTMLYEASVDGILENKEFEKWCKNGYSKINKWFDDIIEFQRKKLISNGLITLEEKKKFGLFTTKVYTATSELRHYAEEVYGLKHYLLDYTLIKERKSIEVRLFEEYLIFAQMLGIAKEVAKEFKDLYPDIIEQSSFNSYDNIIYIHMCANHYVSTVNTAQARAESYSSGGGGFSSGGGGGGSFGGGGGGGGFR